MNTSRLFARQLLVTYGWILLLSFALLGAILTHLAYAFHRQAQADSLAQIARAAEPRVREQLLRGAPGAAGDELCTEISDPIDARVTLIRPDGVVVGDSAEKSTNMENHARRPEVVAALSRQVGHDVRTSYTVDIPFMYVAVPLQAAGKVTGILRLARPIGEVDRIYAPLAAQLWQATLLVALAGLLAQWYLSRRLARPVDTLAVEAAAYARGEFNRRVVFPHATPLDPLADSLNEMARALGDRIREVTRSRNEREAILASMREGVLALDREERILMINRAAEGLLGVKGEEVVGRMVQEGLRHAELQRFLHRARAGADLLAEDNLLAWDDDRLLSVQSVPLRDEQRRETGLLIVMSDVTRLHRLEDLRREFVANVSHELRTPITSIKGFIETLRDGAINDPEHAGQFLDIIVRQADRLNAIIEDLLTLSRIEREDEKSGLELKNVSLGTLIEGVAQHFLPRSEERKVRIETDCPAELTVQANARLLEQAVSNLVDNALKFTDSGRAVHIDAALENGEVQVRVTDEGCGIAAQHLPRLFERFYRVDQARSRQMGGTGLGLAIVKHIMQAHAGLVTVESQPGKGSTFTLHLPHTAS